MPAKDKVHDIVKNALINDGSTITHDPFSMKLGSADLFVDLGAEKLIAAEKGNAKIAVEVKSFLGKSIISETQDAIGQFIMYQVVMSEFDLNRVLYLAIEEEIFDNEFSDALKTLLLEKLNINLLIFRASEEGIVKWLT
jgi:hypothetical protein